MSIGNLILDVNSVKTSYLIRYYSLLQNATDTITECDSYFITKCDRNLSQNAPGFLLLSTELVFDLKFCKDLCYIFMLLHLKLFKSCYFVSASLLENPPEFSTNPFHASSEDLIR